MRNKNNIRKKRKAGGYQDWLEENEGYDPASPENLGENASLFHIGLTPPLLDDMYEVLEKMYYAEQLKGRQKQIAALLLDGFTNQVEMAEQLGMKQFHVADELRKIGKKILKNIV